MATVSVDRKGIAMRKIRLSFGIAALLLAFCSCANHEVSTESNHDRAASANENSQKIPDLPDDSHIDSLQGFKAMGTATLSGSIDPIATKLNPVEKNPIPFDAFHNVSFSRSGKHLAVGIGTGHVAIFEIGGAEKTRKIAAHDNWAFSVLFFDEKTMATAGGDNLIKFWDLTDADKPPRILRGHEKDVHAIAFTMDRKTMVSSSDDKSAKIWDVESGRVLKTLTGHSQQIPSIAISNDGRRVATGSRDGTVKIWDGKTGENLHTFVGHEKDVLSVHFTSNGQKVLSGSYDGTIRVWDSDMGYSVRKIDGHVGSVVSIDISPDDKLVASVDDKQIRISTIEKYTKPKVKNLVDDEAEQISFIRYSPNGKTLAVTTTKSRVLIVNAETLEIEKSLSLPKEDPNK
ncbi:WD40 repeat domain-containing protein [Vicingaceae bacterium]|nr:WD40 repeat domain-containing protein [Vicingaceae bacterium]